MVFLFLSRLSADTTVDPTWIYSLWCAVHGDVDVHRPSLRKQELKFTTFVHIGQAGCGLAEAMHSVMQARSGKGIVGRM